MVAIIDYGLGNLASVQKALNKQGISNVITDDHSIIRSSTAILLPGVGSFEQGMNNLDEKGLSSLLTEEVMVKKKKFLGICLGMQLIATWGTEPVRRKGLDWIAGEVVKLEPGNRRIPHLGWNVARFNAVEAAEYGIPSDGNDFYFIHSFQFLPHDRGHVIATAEYNGEVVAAVRHGNIMAVQFHPEKSQSAGLELLSKYFEK